jgi:hypothetical protein
VGDHSPYADFVLSRSFLMPELCPKEPGVNTQQKVVSSPLHDALVRKLHPDKFPRLSSVMAAVVAFVLDTTFIEPPIVEIKVERGVVFARAQGELAPKRPICQYADLLHNWLSLIASAGLTGDEVMEAHARFALRIGFFTGEATA